MEKRALVTGANGFTGTHMVEYLSSRGWEVVATDIRREERGSYYCEEGDLHPGYFEGYSQRTASRFVTADLTDRESLLPLFEQRYDAVFHVASLYDYFAQWDELHKVNVTGARNLGELAADVGVGRFILWSTEGVYGEQDDFAIDEDAPHNPTNLYCKSKAEQEKVMWEIHSERGLPLTVVRPGPIYGPRHTYGVYHILYALEKMGTGVAISLFPKKHALTFPSVHVTDLTRAALYLAERDEAQGEAYNVLSDCIPQVELMEFLFGALGLEHWARVPVWWPLYKAGVNIGLKLVRRLDRRARAKGSRPKVDVPMVEYITHHYEFSNQKLKDTGFEFIYQDPRKGLWEYITWCKDRGWL